MKRLLWGLGIIALLGAGCVPAAEPPANEPAAKESAEAAKPEASPTAGQPERNDNANAPGELVTPPVAPADLKLQPMPAADAAAIDDKDWSQAKTKSGLSVAYPTKGEYAPWWDYLVVAKDDQHLRGFCYVTPDTAYKLEPYPGREQSCQTATAADSSKAGTRFDYFAFPGKYGVNLFVFRRQYRAGYDLAKYAATLDRVIGSIK